MSFCVIYDRSVSLITFSIIYPEEREGGEGAIGFEGKGIDEAKRGCVNLGGGGAEEENYRKYGCCQDFVERLGRHEYIYYTNIISLKELGTRWVRKRMGITIFC